MARQSKVTLHPSFEIGEISPRLFSGYLEPFKFGGVHGMVYNPKHPTADEQGFRQDVIDSLKDAGLRAVRLPGGNFVSCWDWKDSIGPMEQRKVRLDLAQRWTYPNDMGHDEYLQWAEKVGFEPLYTINLGTGDINDAIKIVEYTNHPGGTYWSDLRKQYGHEKPYGVKVWYLGNEMDGPWQLASWEKNPKGYGILTHEVSKAMKFVDGSIETVACVSSSPFQAHYPQWDLEALQECYETVDYISLHHYHAAKGPDIPSLLAGSEMFEDYIRTEIALCDFVKTKLRSTKTMMLSFDEWGSMCEPLKELHYGRNGNVLVDEHYQFDPNQQHPTIDPSAYTGRFNFRVPSVSEMTSTLASASVMLTLMRHADRIKIGCATGGINMLMRADGEHVWKPIAYYPYEDIILYGNGMSLQPEIESDTYDVPGYATQDAHQYDDHYGIKFIESAAAYNDEKGILTVYVINRDWENDSELTLDVAGFKGYEFVEHQEMYSDDFEISNTYENPEALVPTVNKDAKFEDGKVCAVVKKLSWNVFRFKKA